MSDDMLGSGSRSEGHDGDYFLLDRRAVRVGVDFEERMWDQLRRNDSVGHPNKGFVLESTLNGAASQCLAVG